MFLIIFIICEVAGVPKIVSNVTFRSLYEVRIRERALTVALPIFRIMLALLPGTLVPKVSEPNVRRI